MKRFLVACAVVLAVSASLHADVTIKQTISMAGGAAAMTGGMQMPTMTMRIKGLKARTDVDVMGQTMSSIVDLAAKQMYVLNSADKTAKLVDLAAPQAPAAAAANMPKMDAKFAPTGKSQAIDGINCDEYSFAMTIDLAETMAGRGQQMPPEAMDAMRGMKMIMNGSIWVTKTGPGVAEYVAFQKAAADSPMAAAMAGAMAGSNNGMDKVMSAAAKAQGMPYLTEIDMTMEGGSGQMAEMMAKMGSMKMTNKVTDVSTAAIADDLFKVPADYKVTKQ